MDNLINFEDENLGAEKMEQNHSKHLIPITNAQFITGTGRPSLDLNNPFDKCEYRAQNILDPFDCVQTQKEVRADPVANKY